MQKITTRVFIYALLVFGILGLIMLPTGAEPDKNSTGFTLVVTKLFIASTFIVMPSFALSVTGKYLKTK